MLKTVRNWFATSVVLLILTALIGVVTAAVFFMNEKIDSYEQVLENVADSLDTQLANVYKNAYKLTTDQEVARVINSNSFDLYRGSFVSRQLERYWANMNLISTVFIYNKRLKFFISSNFVYPRADLFPDTGWLEYVDLDEAVSHTFARTVYDSRFETDPFNRTRTAVVTIAMPLYVNSTDVWLVINLDAVQLKTIMSELYGQTPGTLRIDDIDEVLCSVGADEDPQADRKLSSLPLYSDSARLRAISTVFPWQYRISLTTGQYLSVAASSVYYSLLLSSIIIVTGSLAYFLLSLKTNRPLKILIADLGGKGRYSKIDVLTRAHYYIISLEESRKRLEEIQRKHGSALRMGEIRQQISTGAVPDKNDEDIFREGKRIILTGLWMEQSAGIREIHDSLLETYSGEEWLTAAFMEDSVLYVLESCNGSMEGRLPALFELPPRHYIVMSPEAEDLKELRRRFSATVRMMEDRFYHPFGTLSPESGENDSLPIDHAFALESFRHVALKSVSIDRNGSPANYAQSVVKNRISRGQVISELTHILIEGETERDLISPVAIDDLLNSVNIHEMLGITLRSLGRSGEFSVEGKDVLTERVMRYVDEHYRNPLNLNELADDLGYSPTYLSRRFKSVTQTSFSHYLNEIRIRNAIKLMADPALTLQEISRKTGYASYQTFNRIFRKHAGKSPAECRKSE